MNKNRPTYTLIWEIVYWFSVFTCFEHIGWAHPSLHPGGVDTFSFWVWLQWRAQIMQIKAVVNRLIHNADNSRTAFTGRRPSTSLLTTWVRRTTGWWETTIFLAHQVSVVFISVCKVLFLWEGSFLFIGTLKIQVIFCELYPYCCLVPWHVLFSSSFPFPFSQ